MRKSLESIATRAISILAKFLLITLLVKLLALDDYGSFQLISYFMLISVYIYGLEFYMYGNREIAKDIDRHTQISEHIHFFITLFPITFLIQLIGMYFMLPQSIWSIDLFLFILFINFSEYFSQEVYRYLIIIKEVTKANILLICKSLLFLLFIFLYSIKGENLTLSIVLYLMFFSYIIFFILSIYLFKTIILDNKKILLNTLSFDRLKSIFKILMPFIVLMIFTKGLEFFDKFFINYVYGLESVGIYSFLFSIGILIHVFVVSGFYIIYLPLLIKQYEEKNQKFKIEYYKLTILIFLSTILLSLLIILFIQPLLDIIGKEEFKSNLNLLYILLGAFSFLNISLIPNILLYITHQEKIIMKITGFSLLINIILNFIFIKFLGINGVAYSLLLTYLFAMLFKIYEGKKIWNQKIMHFL